MAPAQSATLPIIVLPKGGVLLPGIIQRISATPSRPDIPALLANVYTRAASRAPNGRIDNVPVACFPLASPFLSPDGQLLIQNGEQVDTPEHEEVDPAKVTRADLFAYGVAARITGIEGRGTGEFALLVEGVVRIKLEKIYQDRPYLEGKITYHRDAGAAAVSSFAPL